FERAAERAEGASPLGRARGLDDAAEAEARGRLGERVEHARAADAEGTREHDDADAAGGALLRRAPHRLEDGDASHDRGAIGELLWRARIGAGERADGRVERGVLAVLAALGIEPSPRLAGRVRCIDEEELLVDERDPWR